MVGFDARNKHSLDPCFICPVCLLIIRDPVQLAYCGHRQCKTCITAFEEPNVNCTECQEETPKNHVLPDLGFRNDMKSIEIACSLCDWNGLFQGYGEHLDEQHQNPMCNFCSQAFNSTAQLNEHQRNECTRITIPCALKDYGCLDSVYRVQLPEHYLSDIHQKAIMKAICRMKNRLSNERNETPTGMDIEPGQSITARMREIFGAIDVLASGIQALNDDRQSLNNDPIQLLTSIESLSQDSASLKLGIDDQSAFLDGIMPNQEVLSQYIASITQNLEDLQSVSHDGTYIWKISNFAEKMADAQSERQTSIYSAPFYSSLTGYKMRARLYLHGDGNARRTHMSLFFVLMRSEYDAILKFPFKHKVTFCLFDQSGGQKHHVYSFRPDTKSNSFQRPRSEMNIASGIPKFFPLAMIQQEGNPYVRDDTMFIKVMVDFRDMPKTLLPYALSLNPGIPTNTQQTMIEKERLKREKEEEERLEREKEEEERLKRENEISALILDCEEMDR